MKGNHNKKQEELYKVIIVFNISKIQNERKSQHMRTGVTHGQIVFNISKIQNERKSQLLTSTLTMVSYCVQHIKDTK